MDMPRHLCLFSPRTVARAIDLAGMKLIKVAFDKRMLGFEKSLAYVARETGSKWARRLNTRFVTKLVAKLLALSHRSDAIRVRALKVDE